MWNDPTTVWGKNPELESFWQDLASARKVVLIYRDNSHMYVELPKITTKKHGIRMREFEEDSNIVAILSSNPSQDAYEVYLYPKAKDKSVNYVIEHYKKYFKPIVADAKLRVPL